MIGTSRGDFGPIRLIDDAKKIPDAIERLHWRYFLRDRRLRDFRRTMSARDFEPIAGIPAINGALEFCGVRS